MASNRVIIKYRISSIGIVKYDPKHIDSNKIFSKNDVIYNINYSLDWLNELKEIACSIKINVFSKDPKEELLSSTIRCNFYIENYNEAVTYDKEGGRYTDSVLLEEIFATSISTARGILYVKTRTNPAFENILVPTVNVKEMVKRVQDFPEGDGTNL